MVFNKKKEKFNNGSKNGGPPFILGCLVMNDLKASSAVDLFFRHRYLKTIINL
jgi:hypothetical protein